MVAATDKAILPLTEPVFTFRDVSAVLILAIVPVTTNLVLLPLKVNPLAAVRPVVVFNTNVVPVGGFTKLIDANNVTVELNPLNTNPLASCAVVDCKKDLESGADTLWPNPKNDVNKSNVTNRCFIILLLD
jgi:hypothetical protein